ncbi:MAG TPA: HlyD family efflux transporter periplasmic adaptor subunit, partial [Burkholderiales bacterium]|nr:HlyD family efflux transporter periplasmic adaptor subunit [Burkholderiales bacterium]
MRRLAIILVLLAGCGKEPNDAWQGYIEGEYVLLASPYAGQLEKLHVRRGERIETGKPVFALEQESERAARLEAEERLKAVQARLGNLKVPKRPPEIEALRAQLNQARAARDLAALQLEQAEKLFKESFVAQTRLDEARATHEREVARVREAEAQLKTALQPLGRDAEREAAESEVDAAKAALAQAAWRLEQKSLSAPATGLVHETFFVEGEWVPAGRPVVALLPPGNVKARFYVPETSLSAVSVGRDIEIRCDGCPAPITAKVTY